MSLDLELIQLEKRMEWAADRCRSFLAELEKLRAFEREVAEKRARIVEELKTSARDLRAALDEVEKA